MSASPPRAPLSYLVSTAGHAQEQNEINPHDVRSVLQLITDGADEFGDEPVVGFTELRGEEWTCDHYSFPRLLRCAESLAGELLRAGLPVLDLDKEQRTVCLICPTGADFLITWIALMRLGYAVVFVAPQCSSSAVKHLYTATSSARLVYHTKYTSLAHASQVEEAHLLPLPSEVQLADITHRPDLPPLPSFSAQHFSHVFHTSGTSGMPKPIAHTHLVSVASLPRRALPRYLSSSSPNSHASPSSPAESAAYTTTPLFHGGVSDLLRAWMARSVLYFFPTSDVPVTADNIVASVRACSAPPATVTDSQWEESTERAQRYKVAAFLSVPYILNILADAEDPQGMDMLKGMDLVSTGGAPLDPAVGARMVQSGVRLVSRLGSSECGFLLSSYRDFDTDPGWDWLRNDSAYASALHFERVEESGGPGSERYEMVVTAAWRSKTKSNREDGSYATGDLYEPHPTLRDVWRYVGRGDDVVVLSNGEKASPAPIEAILTRCRAITDALVVGADKDQLGVLLFPSASVSAPDSSSTTPDTAILAHIQPYLRKANAASPTFAQVSRDMCTVVRAPGAGAALPKSSKGTIQRGVAYELFRAEIAALYEGGASLGQDKTPAPAKKRTRAEIEARVRGLVVEVCDLGDDRAQGGEGAESLEQDTDLFNWGVDSLKATRLRNRMQREFSIHDKKLPANVVFERPTSARLSKYLYDLQEGHEDEPEANDDPYEMMWDLVWRYGTFPRVNPPPYDINGDSNLSSGPRTETPSSNGDTGQTILLTGATGSLGAFILAHLLAPASPIRAARVVCLVRAKTDTEARARLERNMRDKGLSLGLDLGLEPGDEPRIEVRAAGLGRECLGLEREVYEGLERRVDVIIHAAWPVHFTSSLVSFEDSIRGLHNLLHLARSSHRPCHFVYCSSLASILASPSDTADATVSAELPLLERLSDNPRTASALGYSRSKWVAERVCTAAAQGARADGKVEPESVTPSDDAAEAVAVLGSRISIVRVGQLCGDTRSPVLVPDGGAGGVGGHWNEKEGWPLLIRTADEVGCLPELDENPSWLPVDIAAQTIIDIAAAPRTENDIPSVAVYHAAHPIPIAWRTVLSGLSASGLNFERVAPPEWLARLDAVPTEKRHGAGWEMLPMWRAAYGPASERAADLRIDTTRAQTVSRALETVEAIDEVQIGRMVAAWRRTGFLR